MSSSKSRCTIRPQWGHTQYKGTPLLTYMGTRPKIHIGWNWRSTCGVNDHGENPQQNVVWYKADWMDYQSQFDDKIICLCSLQYYRWLCPFMPTRWPELLTKKIKCLYCCILARTADLIASEGGRLQVNKSVTSDEGCDGMSSQNGILMKVGVQYSVQIHFDDYPCERHEISA